MQSSIAKHIITAIVATATAFGAFAVDKPALTVRAKADSTTLVMGDQTAISIEVLKNGHPGTMVDMPKREADYYGLEMIEVSADSTDLGNDRVQLNYRFIFQAFDPQEMVTLPPFRYAQDGDTARSEALVFRVLPVDLSPQLGSIENIDSLTIHPDEQPFVIKARWYDFIPDWWIWVLVGLIVVALGIVLALLYKKNGPALFTPRKPEPPYDIAMRQLESLKQKHLLEKGQAKIFYTEVVDILRKYLEGRFGIFAMEMTSKQITRKLRENKETHMSAAQIEQVLQLADIVKFAAENPTPDEGQRTYNTIYQFVESTKPLPETEEIKGKGNK